MGLYETEPARPIDYWDRLSLLQPVICCDPDGVSEQHGIALDPAAAAGLLRNDRGFAPDGGQRRRLRS